MKKKITSIDFLRNIMLKSPETEDRMKIMEVNGTEKGLDHIEIIVGNKKEKWRYKLYVEEM